MYQVKSNHFDEIVSSYWEAACYLEVQDYLRDTIRLVALDKRQQYRCPSCQFSRARHDVMESAQRKNALPTRERRCIAGHMTNSHCKHWQALMAKELEPAA